MIAPAVKLGLIGLGRISKIHLKCITKVKEAELAAVCDIDKKQLERVSQEYGVKGFWDYKELVDYPGVEAVMILTPPETHFEIVEYVLKANKDVFCEKPLAITNTEARAMQKLAAKKKGVFQVGFTERYNEGFAIVPRMIEDGLIGTPFMMRSKRDIPAQFVKDIDWIRDSKRGGGPLAECLIHDIDLARWFLKSEVVAVTASSYQAVFEYFDNVLVLLEFENGALASLSSSWTLSSRSQWCAFCELLGTEGSLEVKNPPQGWVEVNSAKPVDPSYPFSVHNKSGSGLNNVMLDLPHYSFKSGAYINQLRDFINCILKGKTPLAGINEGVAAMKVVEAALQSIAKNSKIQLS